MDTSSGLPAVQPLPYTIAGYSSFSAAYYPENIMKDKSNDQSSRWSSDSNVPPQYLVLKLERTAVVESILFGKFEKTHVCNLRKFRIYGGLSQDCMTLLLEGGLKNDSQSEMFTLRHLVVDGHYLPCRYIKIVPLQSWGPNFNFSIWFVELRGADEPNFIKECVNWYHEYREKEAIRLCLKHLRQTHCLEAFQSLQKKTRVQLEDPLLTELHDAMVLKGDYPLAEKIVEKAAESGLFSYYLSQQEYVPEWQRLESGTPTLPRPGMRGGHQMVIDVATETIYLFGGWDGAQDLSDLWSYHVPSATWTLLCADCHSQGGPSPRSCHKMCLDPESRQLFVLGRYLDSQHRHPSNLKSDFYAYDIERNKWMLVCEDTALEGGPKLVFDHQMCLDAEKRTIYVFGGRILTSNTTCDEGINVAGQLPLLPEPMFSGLFAYHIPTSTWKKLKNDAAGSSVEPNELKARIGHSMLFHPGFRKLYIFAGQRSKEYLNDFFTYDVDNDRVEMVAESQGQGASAMIPAAGFTQRATIDPDLNEIHVLSGLSKEKDKRDDCVRNSFWIYDIMQNVWTCIYRHEMKEKDYCLGSKDGGPNTDEPCPRFAHQLVYDPVRKIHYLFGGNPGRSSDPKMRLDDFWALKLRRPSRTQLLRKCVFLIRKCRFQELVDQEPLTALQFLQTSLAEVVDHSDEEQTKEFRALTSMLFRVEDDEDEVAINTALECTQATPYYRLRSKVFDHIVTYFPVDMTQPRVSVMDLVSLDM